MNSRYPQFPLAALLQKEEGYLPKSINDLLNSMNDYLEDQFNNGCMTELRNLNPKLDYAGLGKYKERFITNLSNEKFEAETHSVIIDRLEQTTLGVEALVISVICKLKSTDMTAIVIRDPIELRTYDDKLCLRVRVILTKGINSREVFEDLGVTFN